MHIQKHIVLLRRTAYIYLTYFLRFHFILKKIINSILSCKFKTVFSFSSEVNFHSKSNCNFWHFLHCFKYLNRYRVFSCRKEHMDTHIEFTTNVKNLIWEHHSLLIRLTKSSSEHIGKEVKKWQYSSSAANENMISNWSRSDVDSSTNFSWYEEPRFSVKIEELLRNPRSWRIMFWNYLKSLFSYTGDMSDRWKTSIVMKISNHSLSYFKIFWI